MCTLTGQTKPVTDSYAIAEYLDAHHPNTPQAFPKGTEALQVVFYRFINEKMAAVLVPCIPGILDKKSSVEYFTRTRTEELGKSLEEARLEGQYLEKVWERIRALFDELESWYAKSKAGFLVGDEPSFGDFTLARYL